MLGLMSVQDLCNCVQSTLGHIPRTKLNVNLKYYEDGHSHLENTSM